VTIDQFEQQLSDFNPNVRGQALADLKKLADMDVIQLPAPKPEVNIHFHTFFSFNAEGWSPTRIAWEARKYGLGVAGIVDFDVLDGREEFLDAAETLGLKASVGMETRVFVSEYADTVLNSPNEPGILYFMAQGVFKNPEPGSKADDTLKMMSSKARERNLGMIGRINDHLGDVVLDYDLDVLPLTPSGNATERHLLLAYDRKGKAVLGYREAAFWAGVFGITEAEAADLVANTPAFHEKMRSKLMKFGGVGYVKADGSGFPSMDEVIAMARGMEALPTTTWLDGTNPGEDDMMSQLELFTSKGVVAINIVPDRNWNIKNADEKALKLKKLAAVMEAARAFDLPLSVGTEMNKAGLPFVDNFKAPELADYINDFVHGAEFFYGHTLLARWADFGYFSKAAQAVFGDDRKAKNAFFAEVGIKAKPNRGLYELLKSNRGNWEPGKLLEVL
jgi:hypothetical protein